MKSDDKLTIFADAQCPLCVMEMKHLKSKDKQSCIQIEDINAPDFSKRFPDINPEKASRVLHGRLDDGRLVYGLDVSHKAWSIVGKPYLFGPLRWPVIKPIADLAYRFFAKNRFTISKLLTGKSRIES